MAGEDAKEGIAPDDLGAFIARSEVEVAGLATMPPFAEDPEDSRRYFTRLAELASGARPSRAFDGYEPGLAGSGGRRRNDHPLGFRLRLDGDSQGIIGKGNARKGANRLNQWHSETHGTARSSISALPRITTTTSPTCTSPRRARTRESATSGRPAPRATVSRLGDRRRGQDEIDDIFADDAAAAHAEPAAGRQRGRRRRDVRVHLVNPTSFNDAQEVADRFKHSTPVILNLQTTDAELSKRLIDFASGLTYALDGGMQKVAEKTFMLTPRNVEVSAEQTAQLVEKGFFNQS